MQRKFSFSILLSLVIALCACTSAFAQSPAQDVYNPDGDVLDFVATPTPTPVSTTAPCDESTSGSTNSGSGTSGCGEVESATECGSGTDGSSTNGSGTSGSGADGCGAPASTCAETNGSGTAGSGASGCGEVESGTVCGSGTNGTSNTSGSGTSGSTDCGTTTPVVSKGELPFTGFQAGLVALMGLALLGGGVAMRRFSRQD